VGQNSTQKPQALQRSTTMETRPFAMDLHAEGGKNHHQLSRNYAF
jgi:hypothetical protein